MKRNRGIIGRLGRLALCACLLTVSLGGCAERPPAPDSGEAAVIRSNLYRHGRYIYESGNRMKRYDPTTHTRFPACLSPDCLRADVGGCPLDNVITEANGIWDGCLYFYSFEAFTHRVMLGYQNLVSGEVKVLVELSSAEQGSTRVHVYDGYMYYQCKRLREGGDPSNPLDYDATLCRVSVKGGRSETICKTDDRGLLMGMGGILLWERASVLYTYDIPSGTFREWYDLEKNGFKSIKSALFFTNGRVYFLASTGDTNSDASIDFFHTLTYLVSVDLQTGTGGKLLEFPVEFLDVTEEGIYYIPYRLRILFSSGDATAPTDAAPVSTQDDGLWMCDFDGTHPRRVAEKPHVDAMSVATVSCGELYGMLVIYDGEAHTRAITSGSMNLASGEVTRVTTEGEGQP